MTAKRAPEWLIHSNDFSDVAKCVTPSPRKLAGACGTAALLSLWLVFAPPASAQNPAAALHDGAEVQRAFSAELKAAQDTNHPMRYRLRKSTPRLTSIKEIIETNDGAVARLVSINDNPPSEADRQKDDLRLDALLADPTRQHKRKQNEQDDTGRAMKVLRALPKAFIYQYTGSVANGSTTLDRFAFTPNPKFSSPDLETQVLTEMTGEILVDPVHQRVVRLEGHLQHDVDFGWGILARLNKGGWLVIEQANVGADQWRIVHFQMVMSGRVLIKTRSFDTTEEETHFEPVPVGLTYQQAIQMLRPAGAGSSGR